MSRTMLFAVMAIVLFADSAFAQAPPDTGEIIFKVLPGAIALGPADSCIVQDPALAAIVAAEGKLRWVREFRPGAGNTFVFVPTNPGDRSAIMGSLRALSGVVHAEPNALLLSDTISSEPDDFYFQEDYWPYPPFSEANDLRYPQLDWPNCSVVAYNGNLIGTFEDFTNLRDQWNLRMTQTNLAWLVEDGDPAVKVAIIDSGVDWRHPDLAENIWQNLGENVGGEPSVMVREIPGDIYSPWTVDAPDVNGVDDDENGKVDDLMGLRIHDILRWGGPPTLPLWDPGNAQCGSDIDLYHNGMYGKQGAHGTQMASIIGAVHNGFGCIGVCPRVTIVPINAGAPIEYGDVDAHAIAIDEMLEAIDYAILLDVDIINISLSYSSSVHEESTDLRDALDDAAEAGIIICCSAGNLNNEVTRWPAAWDAVLATAVVGPDMIKAHQSCFASYVDFCAPSGEKKVNQSDPAWDDDWESDEYMAAVVWGPPDPYWVDVPGTIPPHDAEHDTGDIHTYKQLDGDTSGGAAQLSGAFALLKAHYPEHSRQDLIDEMVRGAVDVDAIQEPIHQGKLGSGLINPYRSLTEWGGPRDSELPAVTWSGEVWVSGDYTVPANAVLTIAPGTTVYIANFDNEATGTDPQHIEIAGRRIRVAGTAAAPVDFVSFGPDAEGAAELVFRQIGPDDSQPVRLQHCNFTGFSTLSISGAASEDSTLVLNCSFTDPVNGGPVRLAVDHAWFRFCTFDSNCTLNLGEGGRLEHCDFIGLPTLSVIGSGSANADSTIVSSCSFADPGNGESVLLEVEQAWLRGCTFESGWTVVPGDNVHLEWCKFEHVPGTAPPLPPVQFEGGSRVFVEHSIFRDAEVAIRAVAGTADTLFLSNVLVEHAYDPQGIDRGELGVDVQGGVVQATGLTVRGYTVGVSLQGSGRFSAEYSSFTDCYQAALNNPGDNLMFFGYYQEPPNNPLNKGGYNVFVDNEKFNIVNIHPTGTISARQNWWGSPSGPPAKSNKGRVDALFPLLVDPNLPPPPDFMVLVEEPSPPFTVGRNYPNPFNPITEFTVTVPRGGGLVRATVYDIRGRAVRRLLDKALPSGEHRIEFNGKNDAGEALPSGMYLCQFNFRDREEVVKATLVK